MARPLHPAQVWRGYRGATGYSPNRGRARGMPPAAIAASGGLSRHGRPYQFQPVQLPNAAFLQNLTAGIDNMARGIHSTKGMIIGVQPWLLAPTHLATYREAMETDRRDRARHSRRDEAVDPETGLPPGMGMPAPLMPPPPSSPDLQ